MVLVALTFSAVAAIEVQKRPALKAFKAYGAVPAFGMNPMSLSLEKKQYTEGPKDTMVPMWYLMPFFYVWSYATYLQIVLGTHMGGTFFAPVWYQWMEKQYEWFIGALKGKPFFYTPPKISGAPGAAPVPKAAEPEESDAPEESEAPKADADM